MADDLFDRIRGCLMRDLGPALAMDANQLEVVAVEDRVVRVRLHGQCGCNPSSIMAILMGLEEHLRRHIAEADYLEIVP